MKLSRHNAVRTHILHVNVEQLKCNKVNTGILQRVPIFLNIWLVCFVGWSVVIVYR